MSKRQKKVAVKNVCDKIHELDMENGNIHTVEKRKSVELDLQLGGTGGVTVCSKCKSNNVKTQSVQVKRADEGPTLFCICRNCNKKWKEQQ